MIHIINWNIRGMKSKCASERLEKLVRLHKVHMVVLQEPFLTPDQIENYRIYLGFDQAASNRNSKIWCFWKGSLNCSVIENSRQQLTLELNSDGNTSWITMVYARTKAKK